ncbi:PAS domain-containing sensor histidine kinase [Spirosoma sp. KUDC1026]|uniref:sensor histidine kinase n=1 Tax=Spirosoma sp. KUDC1026 TaxID=2745947 RepID=UPI00159B89CB|nr:PAS domain-containing sensor histidine kinase [Spirosoma sp. KUDC1026]QKZ14068.1 PAS domain S-box protein [Spirosoma sp. KUDC1026]
MPTTIFSRTLTDLLFEQSDDFIGIYEMSQGRFTRVNQAGVQMLGFPSEQALLADSTWFPAILTAVTDDRQVDVTLFMDRMRSQARFEREAELSRQDGTLFWGRVSLTFVNEEQMPYFLVRLTNLVRLYQAERSLKQSVQRYEAVYTNATIAIIVADQQGQIVSVNRLARQLFGYPDGELTGQPIEVLVPTQVSQYHERLRQSFNANPQVRAMGHNRDLHARRKDGSVFPVEISLSYFRMDDELYAVAYIIDITFKKEAERELLAHRDRIERLNAELEQKVADRTHALMNTLEQLEHSKDELAKALTTERELGELKSRFVSMASHEFRTPLTTVLTSATLIEKYPASDQQDKRQKHLQRIRASVNHLNDILEEFLSVDRLEEGRIEARPMQIDVAELIQEVTDDMQGLLKPGQTIRPDLQCQSPIWVDPSLLRKVLVNLFSNAIKYSDANSVVTVRCSCSDDQIELSIIDQGVGISRDDQEHLFERFFRAHNVTNIPGTGLGLHIVARYIDLMGGRVDLQSELNKGTTVTLLLPNEDNSVN